MRLLNDVSLNLPPEALFFAANMLHAKVRAAYVVLSYTGAHALCNRFEENGPS